MNDSLPSWLSTRPPCYADTEDGDYVQDPGHVEILGMLADLNATTNTFFVIYPDDEDIDWSISVHTRPGALGGYEIEHHDAATSELTTTTEADHTTITSHLLDWISHR
ncbi:hypothetical protein [Cellulosimicrobium protaetiae]|uniref:Uncharacterized protein n=1 Tax=Cellulosimicrobium protaetiae TaxID=2587808 RepID=A0A6M5UEW4_9MICO|nr:hypothetical protein [Cellulosimicrobium protaetiae]QJW35658.1 hypothetical protein FIC82_005015 [Cellulosimicrobium protaetiae]QJW38089.1 hypothetical protein FIC82_019845 [Cellulosimicrobium protaetiae]